jgi:hypothetical protein
MAFFKYYKKINYDPDNIGSIKAVNILNSILLQYAPINDTISYYGYTLLDGEKPEDVSYKLYNTPKYHWTILLLNNIIDPQYDWLLSSHELELYMKEKYQSTLYSIHHFEYLDTGETIDQYNSLQYYDMIENDIDLPYNITGVSNRQYEILENEKKREIRVISQSEIRKVAKNFEDMMRK